MALDFNDPRGVAAALGMVYVADTLNNRVCAVFPNQTSVTLAGGGASGSLAGFSDGVGTAALFNMPTGIAADAAGLVYVADAANHRLRIIFTNNRSVTTLAGGALGSVDGIGTAARFSSPSGVALDLQGALFVADSGNNKVRVVHPNRTVLTFAGGGAAGSANGIGALAQFNGPAGVSVAAPGLVYVADTLNHKVRIIYANRTVANLAGGGAGGATAGAADGTGSSALFDQPLSIAVNSLGTVIVADTNNNKLRAIYANRSVVTLAGGSSGGSAAGSLNGLGTSALFNLPGAVAVDAAGSTLFVADSSNHKIRYFIPGASMATYTGGGAGSLWGVSDGVGSSALFLMPRSTAVGPGGVVYVADSGNHLIRAIHPNRTVVTVAGGASPGFVNGVGANARFDTPSGVAASALGIVYVADASNHKVRLVFPNRSVTTLAGGGASGTQSGSVNGFGGSALFLAPRGVAVDAAGAVVHVADAGNNKIRSISPSGMVVTLAGGSSSGTMAGASDGVGSAALFSQPSAVAVDAAGTVFVADANNHRIRAIFVNRTVITLAGSAQGSANGLGASALFSIPNGLAVGPHGILYVADYGNHKVRAVLPNRSVVTVAGGGASGTASGAADGAATSALFFRVYGLSVHAGGALYVADETHRVRQVHPPLCPPGAALPAGALACALCPGGHACPAGSFSWAGLKCGLGHYCPDGSPAPLPCPAAVPPVGGVGRAGRAGPRLCGAHCALREPLLLELFGRRWRRAEHMLGRMRAR